LNFQSDGIVPRKKKKVESKPKLNVQKDTGTEKSQRVIEHKNEDKTKPKAGKHAHLKFSSLFKNNPEIPAVKR
jgi:hypothetical protein